MINSDKTILNEIRMNNVNILIIGNFNAALDSVKCDELKILG